MANQYANDFNNTVTTYYNELRKYKPLTRAREKRLLRLCKKGNIKAQNEIIESNLKFVFDIAKHYTGRGVSISDLISEGNMGLLKAIDKFDNKKDVKFISYAVWWIRQFMLDSIRKRKLLNIVEIDNKETNLTIENTISDDEDETVNNNDKAYSNESEEYRRELNETQKEVIKKLLNSLNKREKEIIENYYGINGKEELNLSEIGDKFGLTSERVRQIKLSAFKKLRTSMMMYNDYEELL